MKKYDLEKPTNMRGDLLEYLRQKKLKNSTIIMDEREIMNNILIFL